MNHEEILEVVEYLESRIDVNSVRSGEIPVWPIFRIAIDTMLHQRSSDSRPGHFHNLLNRIGSLVNLLFSYLISQFYLSVGYGFDDKSQVLLLSQPSHHTRIDGRIDLFDRIIDPFCEVLNGLVRYQKVLMGVTPSSKMYIKGFSFPRLPQRRLSSLRLTGTSALYTELTELGIDICSFDEILFKELSAFHQSRKISTKILLKMPQLTHLVVSCWYSSLQLGVIYTCRQHDLIVVNVQHGSQFGHSLFSGWANIPNDGYDLLPNIFLCWGQTSANEIDRWTCGSSVHKPMIVGYPWKDFRSRLLSSSPNDVGSANGLQHRVLVTLQGDAFANNARRDITDLAAYLFDLGVEAKFRFHPNDSTLKSILKPLIEKYSGSKLKFVESNDDLYSLLEESSHHITWFSSCCFDALASKVPTLLLGVDSKYVYRAEIMNQVFSWSANVDDCIRDFLNKSNEVATDSNTLMHTTLDQYRSSISSLLGLSTLSKKKF
jgi:hypothetical protein